MSNEHPFHIDIHARAFTKLWNTLDSHLLELDAEYSSKPVAVADQEEKFYMGLYVAAAGSHIQIVTACTLLESLISKEFQQNGELFQNNGNSDHLRWKAPLEHALNPRTVVRPNGKIGDRNNFIDGHIQLCEACNIEEYLDDESNSFLKTILFYRNYVVHNGLEWGEKNVQEFRSKVGKAEIENYFDTASSADTDWVYTAKPETIQKLRKHVSAMIKRLDELF